MSMIKLRGLLIVLSVITMTVIDVRKSEAALTSSPIYASCQSGFSRVSPYSCEVAGLVYTLTNLPDTPVTTLYIGPKIKTLRILIIIELQSVNLVGLKGNYIQQCTDLVCTDILDIAQFESYEFVATPSAIIARATFIVEAATTTGYVYIRKQSNSQANSANFVSYAVLGYVDR